MDPIAHVIGRLPVWPLHVTPSGGCLNPVVTYVAFGLFPCLIFLCGCRQACQTPPHACTMRRMHIKIMVETDMVKSMAALPTFKLGCLLCSRSMAYAVPLQLQAEGSCVQSECQCILAAEQ